MKTHMFLTNNIDNLEATENELESLGIPRSHIKIYSDDEAGLYTHHLPSVPDISKRDVIHSGFLGALIGALAAIIILISANSIGWTTNFGWMPFVFLALVVFGFSAWEGGLMGINKINHRFQRVQELIQDGAYLLIVSVNKPEEEKLATTMGRHPEMRLVS